MLQKNKLPYTTKVIAYKKTNKSKQTISSLEATPILLEYKNTIIINLWKFEQLKKNNNQELRMKDKKNLSKYNSNQHLFFLLFFYSTGKFHNQNIIKRIYQSIIWGVKKN